MKICNIFSNTDWNSDSSFTRCLQHPQTMECAESTTGARSTHNHSNQLRLMLPRVSFCSAKVKKRNKKNTSLDCSPANSPTNSPGKGLLFQRGSGSERQSCRPKYNVPCCERCSQMITHVSRATFSRVGEANRWVTALTRGLSQTPTPTTHTVNLELGLRSQIAESLFFNFFFLSEQFLFLDFFFTVVSEVVVSWWSQTLFWFLLYP